MLGALLDVVGRSWELKWLGERRMNMFELLIAWCPFVVYSPLYRSV